MYTDASAMVKKLYTVDTTLERYKMSIGLAAADYTIHAGEMR